MSQNLKKLIKEYVRESLVEVLAEMHLEKIVENAVLSSFVKSGKSLTESASRPKTPPFPFDSAPAPKSSRYDPTLNVEVKESKKRAMLEKLGVDDGSVWKDIYEDSAESLMNESSSTAGVPVDVLEKTGILRDYSKFVEGSSTERKTTPDDDWQRLREEREKKLSAVIKRPNQ